MKRLFFSFFLCILMGITVPLKAQTTATQTSGSRNISVANLDYQSINKNGLGSSQGLDRTVRGITLTFSGDDGVKYNNDGQLLWRKTSGGNIGSITIGLDPAMKSGRSGDAKIKSITLATNTDKIALNDGGITMSVDADTAVIRRKDYTGNATPGSGSLIQFNFKTPCDNVTLTNVSGPDIRIASFYIEYEDGELGDEPCAVTAGTNDDVMLSVGKSAKLANPATSVQNLGGADRWTYTVSPSTGLTLTTDKNGVASISASDDGTYTITAEYTPSDAAYFTPVTDTYTVKVIEPVSRKVWNFDKSLDTESGKGIGSSDEFTSASAKALGWTPTGDASDEYLYNSTINDNAKELTVGDNDVVDNTEGLNFTLSLKGHLMIKKDAYLRLDENGTITIQNVKKNSYVLITAKPLDGTSGFANISNVEFVDNNLTKAMRQEVFMLKATGKNANKADVFDVVIQPTDWMEIYRIEVTDLAMPDMTATTTASKPDSKGEYQVSNGEKFSVTFTMKPTDATGTLRVYALGAIVSGDDNTQDVVSGTAGTATFNATAIHGGDAIFVAMFTPASTETKYTYSYETFTVNVADKTMYRVNRGQTVSVGQEITSVPGIKMMFGGWADATKGTYGKADNWGRGARREAYIQTFPGYDYTFNANQNSANENNWQYTNKNIATYSGEKYWYDENELPNNPYMMPVFGGYLKFTPTRNGVLKVYIHQNGAVMQTTHKDPEGQSYETFNPYMLHMRSYYIADETGKLYTDKDGVKATTYAKAADVWNGEEGEGIYNSFGKNTNDRKGSIDPDDDIDYSVQNDQYKADFEYFKDKYGEAAPTDKPQEVYCKDGGWVMLNEGATEYVIPNVKAGKTYFVFTNKTKLGFYGFKFEPYVDDETAIPDDSIQTLELPAESSTADFNVSLADNKTYFKVDPNFKKTLKAGMWNAVCLPFSLNEEQTKAAFGEGVEILDFDRVENANRIVFKKHHYQMIVAGRPYIVFVPQGDKALGDNVTMAVPTDFVSTSAKALAGPINNVVGSDGTYTWLGTYKKLGKSTENTEDGTFLPKNAYFFSLTPNSEGKTVMKQNTSGKSTLSGYRAYLTTVNGEAPAKSLTLSYDGVDDDVVTGIDDILPELIDPEPNGRVYNLSGQLVSRNGLASLPKGIYIMNGRKYVIK